jgi:two-component system, chemotaxis family, protein-glutamate methylesterase/glutaminase
MTRRIRTLVVDDSAFARKVLRQVLAAAGDVEVVGAARDGIEALELIEALRPDVVTLDLVMPELDGVGVLRALGSEHRPGIVVVSVSDENSELAVEALALGAVDYVSKPTSLATDRLYELGDELVQKVRLAAAARAAPPRPPPSPAWPPAAAAAGSAVSLIVIGASTGGPQALSMLVPALPADLPVPVVIAIHIPAEYTGPMAARLDRVSAIRVVEAEEGLVLRPGVAVLARGSADLALERRGDGIAARIVHRPERVYHPSVDVLLESAARVAGPGVLGIVLTGMGDDGVQGARAVKAAGGRVIVESERSCVIYGMPRAVMEAGLSDADAPLEELPAEILRRLGR